MHKTEKNVSPNEDLKYQSRVSSFRITCKMRQYQFARPLRKLLFFVVAESL